jgi:hypothetical protein
VITVDAFDALPAASSTVTVILFEPVCSWIEAAVQVASVLLPSRLAVPWPPRSFIHMTRCRRMLSAALPFRPTRPVEPAALWPSMLSVGATESMRRQRRRSASSRLTESVATSSVVAPPQPIKVNTVTASAMASMAWWRLVFIGCT